MYKIAVVMLSAVLFAYVLARPAAQESSQSAAASAGTTTTTAATIIKQIDITNPDGSYNSRYVSEI